MCRMLLPSFNEFTSWCIGEKDLPVNQIITKHTAHPPTFEIGQMCGSFCRLLIFRILKKKVHHEVNSFKVHSGRPLRSTF